MSDGKGKKDFEKILHSTYDEQNNYAILNDRVLLTTIVVVVVYEWRGKKKQINR